MSNVKKYNVGQIKLDLPTPNYYHELPLVILWRYSRQRKFVACFQLQDERQ